MTKTLKVIHNICQQKGYKIISEYKGYYHKLKCLCDKNHQFTLPPSKIRINSNINSIICPHCYKQEQKEIFFETVVKKKFIKNGYSILTTEYIDEKQKLDCICPNGHQYKTSWSIFRSGTRCAKCKTKERSDVLKNSYEYIKSYIESFGFKLLSKEYHNNIQKLKISCKNDHIKEMAWKDFISSKKICQKCKMDEKFRYIKQEFEKNGYILLSKEYKNQKTILHYICPNGHKHYIRWNDFRRGHRCIFCAPKLKYKLYDFEQIQKMVGKEGYAIDENSFIDACKKFKCICKHGHKLNINLREWIDGKRCKRCKNIEKFGYDEFSFDYVKKFIKDNGYKCLSKKYISSQSKLKLKCPNQHIYKVSWNSFSRGKRCPQCYEKGSSFEDEVYDFIKEFYKNEIIRNDRQQIFPFELDFYFPNDKIAIECCGLYWHSEKIVKKNYHYKKYKQCKDKDIRLIQIFEDEWIHKKEVVKSKIRSLLGFADNKINIEHCVSKKIENRIALSFCEKNHINGKCEAYISYGLFHNDQLVSVMIFNKIENIFELIRFCSKLNHNINGTSKLFFRFLKDYPNQKVVSYQDLRWITNDWHKKIGMVKIENIKPDYWYFRNQQRFHRFTYRKSELLKIINEPQLTERELAKKLNLRRIYDAGHLKFIYSPNHSS